jgi:pimeloyl-ACP methyl ester carboxylesterase
MCTPSWISAAALERTCTAPRSEAERLAAIKTAGFVASPSEPLVWRQGWWPAVAAVHKAAILATPREEWWAAGTAPSLVMQGLEGQRAVPANGRALREAFGDRVPLLHLANAGHALLPEQSEAIAKAVVTFLRAHR